MKYPSWAPAELVDNLNHQLAFVAYLQKHSPFSRCQDELDALIDQMQQRLLTDDRAKEIWQTIPSKTLAAPISGNWSIEFDYMTACQFSYKECLRHPKHTAKEKRQHLEKIASLAKSLSNLIQSSPYIKDKQLILETVTNKSFNEWFHVVSDADDTCDQERRSHDEKFITAYESWRRAKGFPDGYEPTAEEESTFHFPDEPQISQARIVSRVSRQPLSGVLDHLANLASDNATTPPIAAQPNSVGWAKAIFTRMMHRHLIYRFGKPMWRTLALTTSVALDLDTLAEEDVMPLVKYQKKTP